MSSSKRAKGSSKRHAEPPSNGVVAVNRRARFDYDVVETVEAGIVLTGTEIKSVRQGNVDLRDAFARPTRGELWLENAHIAPYLEGNVNNHEPRRSRKLLLHRGQIDELGAQMGQKGYTLVPLRVYIKGRLAKVLLGLGKGKRRYQKKEAILERTVERETRRALKESYR